MEGSALGAAIGEETLGGWGSDSVEMSGLGEQKAPRVQCTEL